MPHDVFLSYSSVDRERAVRLGGALERAGLSVWSDANLSAGIPFDRQIRDALAESGALVALISHGSLRSKWVRCDTLTHTTMVGVSSAVDGWRDDAVGKGVVFDVEQSRIACGGLTFPHSPRHRGGKLWLLNSGEGELGYLDGAAFAPVASMPGFARGLAFIDRWAIVGISKPRHGLADGLPIHRRMQSSDEPPQCGFRVIDTATGECAEWFRIDGPTEVSALEVIPHATAVEAYGFDSTIAAEFLSWES